MFILYSFQGIYYFSWGIYIPKKSFPPLSQKSFFSLACFARRRFFKVIYRRAERAGKFLRVFFGDYPSFSIIFPFYSIYFPSFSINFPSFFINFSFFSPAPFFFPPPLAMVFCTIYTPGGEVR